ncbi:MAG: chitobiase/beta-hexosaminidase C-terminal domain-containing protein, partial [Lentisphaerota bacterium]
PIKPFFLNAFEAEDIKADATAQTIRTDSKGETSIKGVAYKQANISLYHIAPMTLEYIVKNEPKDEKKEAYRKWGYGWQRIGAKWTGKGDQQLITAIFPRRPDTGAEGDLKEIKKVTSEGGVTGFDAKTPDGGIVQYRAALGTKGGRLEIGPVKILGEALLLDGAAGIALGCKEMTIDGKPVEIPCLDFEFILNNEDKTSNIQYRTSNIESKSKSQPSPTPDTRQLTPFFTPIYRPIDPVKISPDDCNVFVDNLAVSMASRTPGVEIHYTLDGTDPTPQSPLYTGPVEIKYTTTVKARAYRSAWLTAGRSGIKENPVVLSGTHATVPSLAVFTRAEPLAPAFADGQRKIEPGLTCDYFEGDWMRLWLSLDRIKPLKSTMVSTLFDLNIVPLENPPLGQAAAPREKTYALRYNGYFLAPTDGVYTFHAPREWTMPDIDAGYELQLFLGDKVAPWGWGTKIVGINQWYPSTRLHAFGNWSIALKKGAHRFQLFYLDYRTNAAQRLNQPGLTPYIWDGVMPDLRVSGPGLEKQALPAAWLAH